MGCWWVIVQVGIWLRVYQSRCSSFFLHCSADFFVQSVDLCCIASSSRLHLLPALQVAALLFFASQRRLFRRSVLHCIQQSFSSRLQLPSACYFQLFFF